MGLIREYLFDYYRKEFERMVEEATIIQKEHIISTIHEAEMRGIPVVIELNPLTALGIATIEAREVEEEITRENPFKIVKDDEDE